VLLISPFVISAALFWPGILRWLWEGAYNGASDFDVFYSGAQLFGDGNYGALWDPDRLALELGRDDPFLWYAYPPLYASAWQPLIALSIDAAFVSWTVAGIVMVPLVVRLVADRWDLVAVLLGLASYPAVINFDLGQNAMLAALIVAAAVALVRSGHAAAGGAVFGLLVYKPQLAIGIGVWWLIDRRYRKAAAAALGVAGLIVAVSWALQPAAWSAYLDALSEVAGVRGQNLQVSLAGFFDLLFPDWGPARAFGFGMGIAALVGVGWWLRTEPPFEAALAAAVLVTFLAAPYLLVYDYLIGLGPAALLLRRHGVARLWPAAAVLSWSMLYTYVIRGVLADSIGIQLQVLPLAALLMLWSVVRLRSAQPSPA